MEEPKKYWSRKWKITECEKCGRDKYRHEADRLCRPCYQGKRQKLYRRKRTEELERLRRLEASLKKK